jgi:hypothetical protein
MCSYADSGEFARVNLNFNQIQELELLLIPILLVMLLYSNFLPDFCIKLEENSTKWFFCCCYVCT